LLLVCGLAGHLGDGDPLVDLLGKAALKMGEGGLDVRAIEEGRIPAGWVLLRVCGGGDEREEEGETHGWRGRFGGGPARVAEGASGWNPDAVNGEILRLRTAARCSAQDDGGVAHRGAVLRSG
jgi:hypothetical protein